MRESSELICGVRDITRLSHDNSCLRTLHDKSNNNTNKYAKLPVYTPVFVNRRTSQVEVPIPIS